MMNLRPYQQKACSRITDAFGDHKSTLLVLPTGTGKTIVFANVCKEMGGAGGRQMILAHREELIFQAANKVEEVIGERPDIEMASMKADEQWWKKSQVVVSSVQTHCAGGKGGRMEKFPAESFSLLVIDEAHHATAKTYRRCIDHYQQNTDIKLLGVTATPDRTDEEALGQIFDSTAMVYEINDAIHDGWLVPIMQRACVVDGLDFSKVRTTAGDLNQKDLATVMEYESMLHEIATPTIDICEDRRTLIFATTVAHAERLCEILNRHKVHAARWVSGKTPTDERRQIFRDYASGEFQYLVNVGVATEGFDEPGIGAIVMARPTKSRSLYAQMVGRGTRPLAGVVDPHEDPLDRCEAITSSGKNDLLVLDFVGNSGRHKLISAVDILGGNVSDEVISRAGKIIEEAGEPLNPEDAIEQAGELILEEKRRAITAKARYSTHKMDPFDILDIEPVRERGWNKDRLATDRQRMFLERKGINCDQMTFTAANQLVGELIVRQDRNLCTLKQAKALQRFGYNTREMSFADASHLLTELANNKWKRPTSTTSNY